MSRLVIYFGILLMIFSLQCKSKTMEQQVSEWIKLAEEKANAKVYEDAIYLYDRALKVQPNAEWYIRVGDLKTEFDAARWKESMEDYKKSLALKQDNPELLYKMTDIYLGKEDATEAMKFIRFLIAKGAAEKDYIWRIGMVFQGMKLEEEARYAYQLALVIDPNNEKVKTNLAELDKINSQIQEEWKGARMYNDMKQYEQASVMYQALLDALPFEIGLYDEAIRNLNSAAGLYKVRETKENIREQIKEIQIKKKAAIEQKKKMDKMTDEEKKTAILQGLSFYEYLTQQQGK
jgi:tetratricopeptide (TPR) repeat protein